MAATIQSGLRRRKSTAGAYGPAAASVAAPAPAPTAPAQAATAPAPAASTDGAYRPSAAVNQARDAYRAAASRGPGAYVSPYGDRLDDLYGRLADRESFSYDPESDALYQRYREQYQRLGRRAMEDTLGRAAALTGGYASSYAQQAGQESYDEYLQQLNDKVPELYTLAWQRYRAEGDDLARLYDLLQGREDDAYDRWRDAVADSRADRQEAWDRYTDQRSWDYDLWSDDRDWAADRADRAEDLLWRQTQFDYQRSRDAVSDDHWERSFAASQAAQAARSARSGGSSGSRSRSASAGSADAESAATPAPSRETLVRVPGYGLLSPADAQAMVAAGTLEWARGDGRAILTDEDGRPVARMRRAPVSGAFRMVQ